MCIARHSQRDGSDTGARSGRSGRSARPAGQTERKHRALRTAVTATAAGIALAVPLAAPAQAALDPSVLKRLNLDAVTLSQVKAYDRYRTKVAEQRSGARRALSFARGQIGKPYRWGAAGPYGYDCSGLAMASWRRGGVDLPRVSYSQYASVRRKVGLSDLKPGDLVFFHGRSHVGIYVGGGRFVHAPHTGTRVRIDRLSGTRRKQFAGAVRPGAPAKQSFSPSVRELVEKIDRMSAQDDDPDRKPPDKERTPHSPRSPHKPGRTHHHRPPGHTPAPSAAQAPRGDDTSDHTKPGSRPDRDPAPRPRHYGPGAHHFHHQRPHHGGHAQGHSQHSDWQSWTPFDDDAPPGVPDTE